MSDKLSKKKKNTRKSQKNISQTLASLPGTQMIVHNRVLDGTNQRPKIIKIVILLLSFLTVTPRGTLDFKALYATLFVNVCVSSSIHTKSLTTFDMVVVLELDITMYLH